MILKVGLTGGIASGKSTIARIFAGLGCVVVDADAIVARLYQPGEAGHEAIVRTYGIGILRADGEIDRPKLAALALSTDAGAKQLNALIHPLVIEAQLRMFADEEARFPDRDTIFVIEATLLLESGGKGRYDKIVVVTTSPAVQIARGVARGMDAAEVERRIARQMTSEERVRHADYVIENDGDLHAAELATTQVYESLRADLDRKKAGG